MNTIKNSEQYEFSDTLKDFQVSGHITIDNEGFTIDINCEKNHVYYKITGIVQNVNIEMSETGLTLQELLDYLYSVINYVTNTFIDKDTTSEDSE